MDRFRSVSYECVRIPIEYVIGERNIPVIDAILTAFSVGNDEYAFTIRHLRLPRVLVGFLAGCGLALSGTILQVITRNPLASPGVIGLNAGAAAAVVAVLVLVPTFSMSHLPWVAFGGALVTALVIYNLSWKKGSSTERVLLVGIGISAMAGALITYLLTIGQVFKVSQAFVWMAGSLYGRTWDNFWPLLPWISLLFVLLLLFTRHLDLLQLSDVMAVGIGLRLELIRFSLLLFSVGLAGSAVSMAGTISFVGLMAPHMASHLVGNRSLKRLPVAALLGGLIVMSADLLGRTIFSPFEIPVGLITALLGAPYMITLLIRRRVI
ncbi:iron ABC transporter permease [Paenibacillus sp. L3-i20]|uniref:FecCD family ABC transporter permease n=1 Tax=Paenibacillus sp. L3-i20 TaxID=2905833 RepID=UPI001EE12A28|nr:iron chelate uptake ABC transporter family permease subunit [Paenibacillus sp. L3-i20]GKU76210.1 iron ABC transporter permease [Paenibacillus sp. L3-i20]